MEAPQNNIGTENGSVTTITLTPLEKIWLQPLRSKEEALGKIVRHIIRLGLCARCVFRVLKITDIKFYRDDLSSLEKMALFLVQQCRLKEAADPQAMAVDAATEAPIAFDHARPCPACLGVLQKLDDPIFLQHMIDTIKNSDYETQIYALALTTPVATQVRHYQLWFHLQDTFPNIPHVQTAADASDVPDVKEVFKWIMGHTLFVKIQMRFQFEARFEARLNIHHEETQLECLKLTPEVDPVQFLKQMEAEKRHFLRQAQEVENQPSGEAPAMEEDKNETYDYTSKGPPRKRRMRAAADGIQTVTAKLRSLSKPQIIKLLTPNALVDPETKKQISPPPSAVHSLVEFEFSFHHMSVFVGGRYCKFSRRLSQSPWIVDGVRKTEGSVQEYIGEVLKKYLRADGYKFMSAGREDIDVRMLGNGRPFAVEMINPRRPHLKPEDYKAALREINHGPGEGSLFVRDLQEVSEKQLGKLKDGEDSKRKTYRALVWAATPMTEEVLTKLLQHQDFTIDQLTPIRVLHRRSLMTRKKTIHNMSGQYLNPHYAILDLTTQAGTYIKEFVHSDLGRTKPSFCEFIGQDQADILLLDVMEVALDWPPALENDEPTPSAPAITEGLDLSLTVPEKPAETEQGLGE